MPLIEFPIAPGIVTEGTDRGARGRWRDGNRVRFRTDLATGNALAEKIGGWEAVDLDGTITGVPRSALDWRAIDGDAITAFGTHTRLYQIFGNDATNITPYRLATDAFGGVTSELSGPFDTTISSEVVNVSHTSHGLSEGDTVYFDNASAVGGITIDGEYTVTSVVGVDDYTITHSVAATSTASGGGTVDFAYEISIGKQHGTSGLGYGVGGYGEETYGTARSDSDLTFPARVWALDTWGEDLIANPRGGGIYVWDKSVGFDTSNRAELITNAPSAANWVMVSPVDRHMIAIGCTPTGGSTIDPSVLRWSDQNDYTAWTASRTNTAGERRLDQSSQLISGLRVHEEILIFSDDPLFSMRFVGPPATFNIRRIGGTCGIAGPLARAEYGGRAYWMSSHDFFVYDGSLSILPCDVRNHVFDDLNIQQASKFFAGTNSLFHEVWWFYCSLNSDEIDRYVLFNTLQQTWAIGELDRTAWLDRSSVRTAPAAFDASATFYNHETGATANGSAMGEYLESYDAEIPGPNGPPGDYLLFVNKIVPDFSVMTGNMKVTLKARKYPATTQATSGPFTVTPTNGFIRPRIRGRQMAMRWESDQTTPDIRWRMNTSRIEARPHGRR